MFQYMYPGNPSEASLRSMKLVAKAVQNLANLVSFKTKEPFMATLNPFIIRHMPDMIKFIDKLSVSGQDYVNSYLHDVKIEVRKYCIFIKTEY